MGSKSRTVAVASTLSITSPSMRAGDPGQLHWPREPLWTWRAEGGEPERGGRASERAGANTVHTNLQSAVRRTGNSMESLIGGCSGEAIHLAEGGGGHVPGTPQRQTPRFSRQRLSSSARGALKSKRRELLPSRLHSPTRGAATTLSLVADSSCRYVVDAFYSGPDCFLNTVTENK